MNWTADMHHIFRDRAHLQTRNQIFMMITSFSTSSYAIHANVFQNQYIMPVKTLKMSLILPSLDFTEISPLLHSYYTQHGYCRLLADGKRIFHMECHYSFHYSFGQKTSIQSPLVELQNMFTPPFSIPLQVTHCASNLMKHYLDSFVIALNAAFDQQLLLADEGYESG